MALFDVYENPNDETNQTVPYLLDLQADLLDNLATRVVAPLVAVALMGGAVKHLNPRFKVKGNVMRRRVVKTTYGNNTAPCGQKNTVS